MKAARIDVHAEAEEGTEYKTMVLRSGFLLPFACDVDICEFSRKMELPLSLINKFPARYVVRVRYEWELVRCRYSSSGRR
jgi:hypothetical protein